MNAFAATNVKVAILFAALLLLNGCGDYGGIGSDGSLPDRCQSANPPADCAPIDPPPPDSALAEAIQRSIDAAANAAVQAATAGTVCAADARACDAAATAVAAAVSAQTAADTALAALTLDEAEQAANRAVAAATAAQNANSEAARFLHDSPTVITDAPPTNEGDCTDIECDRVCPANYIFDDCPPFPGVGEPGLIRRAIQAAEEAARYATEAQVYCASAIAACDAAGVAADAAGWARDAVGAAQGAINLADAEHYVHLAFEAADAARDAARTAAMLAMKPPSTPPKPPFPQEFTLQPGTERKLSSESFLVCPFGGSPCHIQSVTTDEDGHFLIELTEGSDKPFYWNSSTSLFTGLLQPYEQRTVRLLGSPNIHVVTCAQAQPCKVDNLRVVGKNRVAWSSNTNAVHVSYDHTGFFLKGDKIINLPAGGPVHLSCPDGCAIDQILVDDHGEYHWRHNPSWEPPIARVVDDDGNLGKTIPPRKTPKTRSSEYSKLPEILSKFPINHLELSDILLSGTRFREPRHEVICPGVGDVGDQCTVLEQVITPSYILSKAEGTTVAKQQPGNYDSVLPNLSIMQSGLQKLARGEPLTQEEETALSGFVLAASWGQYSAFGSVALSIPHEGIDGIRYAGTLHHFAFGDLYGRERGGKPKEEDGSGVWRGPMSGFWKNIGSTITVRYPGFPPVEHQKFGSIGGQSVLEYDFSNNTLDLTLTIEESGADLVSGEQYLGKPSIEWTNVKQNNDGSFFIQGNHRAGTNPDATGTMLDGDFYGPKAEEVAGIFEDISNNYHLSGSFGGRRVKGEQGE